MQALTELVLSLLAVVGLMTVGWLLWGRLLLPVGGGETCTLVPGRGDGENLEQTVKGLLWLQGGGLLTGRVVIVDDGLTPAGKEVAAALCLGHSGVTVCPREELIQYVQEKL
jgi:hypothetical protein